MRHPRVLLALSACAAILAALGLMRFRIDPDVSSLYPQADPTLRLTRVLQGDAGPARTLIIVLRADRPQMLDDLLPEVSDRLRASPNVARVAATREEFAGERRDWYARAPLYFLPASALDRLRERLGPGRREQLARIRGRIAADPIGGKQLALADPLDTRWIFEQAADEASARFPAPYHAGSRHLVFESPSVAFVRVVGVKQSFDIAFTHEFLLDVRARLTQAVAGRATWQLAGGYVTAAHQSATMRADLGMQIAGSGLAVMVFLIWFCRGFVTPHALVVPIGLAILFTLGLAGQLFGPLTPLAVSVSAIMIGQGIDYPIHVFSRYRQERRSHPPAEAMLETLRTLGRPVVGAVATTVLPTLFLLASAFPGIRQFGAILSLGMALCVAGSLTVLVPLLMCSDRFIAPERASLPVALRVAQAVHGSRLRGPVAALVLAAGVTGWAVLGVAGARMDLDVRHAMPSGDPGIETLKSLEADLGLSITPVIGLVDESTPLDELRTAGRAMVGAGLVALVDGPQSLVPDAEALDRLDRFHGATQGWVDGALADLASLGYKPEPFRKALEELDGMLRRPPPTLGPGMPIGFRYVEGGCSSWVLYFFPRRSPWRHEDRQRFDAEARRCFGPALRIYSGYHLPDHYSGVLVRDLNVILVASGAAVVLLTLFAVGGVKDGLLALLPVTVATGITLAVVSALGGVLNVFNLVAFPIVIGVGVDDGIYYVSHLRRASRDAARALADVGTGIWGTTATTILGFGSIAFSRSPGLASLGLLVVVGIGSAFVATVFLLPALAASDSPCPRQKDSSSGSSADS